MELKRFIQDNKDKIKDISNTYDPESNQTYRLIVMGRSGSGKSYWVKHFLEIEMKSKACVTFVLTPIHNKHYYDARCKVFSDISNETILFNIETILSFAEKYPKIFKIIIIFDDIINEKLVNDSGFMNLFGRARHFNINIIFIIQSYTRVLSPFMKNQATHYLLFGLNNPRMERLLVSDFIEPLMSDIKTNDKEAHEKAINMYKDNIVDKKYGNILINYNEKKIML